MKKMNGFTLIELMIVITIIGIIVAIAAPLFTDSESPNTSPGMQGPTIEPDRVTCVEGYKFVHGTQLMSHTGTGIPCNTN